MAEQEPNINEIESLLLEERVQIMMAGLRTKRESLLKEAMGIHERFHDQSYRAEVRGRRDAQVGEVYRVINAVETAISTLGVVLDPTKKSLSLIGREIQFDFPNNETVEQTVVGGDSQLGLRPDFRII